MSADILTALFDPDHVLSLVFYLAFLGIGSFLFKNWREILGHLDKKAELRHKIELERIASDERIALRWQQSMEQVTGVMNEQNSRLTSTEAQMSVLIESMERLFRYLVNGHTPYLFPKEEFRPENDPGSGG